MVFFRASRRLLERTRFSRRTQAPFAQALEWGQTGPASQPSPLFCFTGSDSKDALGQFGDQTQWQSGTVQYAYTTPDLAAESGGDIDTLRGELASDKRRHGSDEEDSLPRPVDPLALARMHHSLHGNMQAFFHLLGLKQMSFGNVLAYSSGAYSALRVALEYPEHIGCIILIDTPVVTPEMAEYSRILSHNPGIHQNENVRDPMVNSARKILKSVADVCAEGPPPAGRESNPLEQPSMLCRAIPLHKLQTIQHPVLLVRPRSGGVCTDEIVEAHKSTFNCAVATLPCDSHEEMLSEEMAPKIDFAVRKLMGDYDTWLYVKKKMQYMQRKYLSVTSWDEEEVDETVRYEQAPPFFSDQLAIEKEDEEVTKRKREEHERMKEEESENEKKLINLTEQA